MMHKKTVRAGSRTVIYSPHMMRKKQTKILACIVLYFLSVVLRFENFAFFFAKFRSNRLI